MRGKLLVALVVALAFGAVMFVMLRGASKKEVVAFNDACAQETRSLGETLSKMAGAYKEYQTNVHAADVALTRTREALAANARSAREKVGALKVPIAEGAREFHESVLALFDALEQCCERVGELQELARDPGNSMEKLNAKRKEIEQLEIQKYFQTTNSTQKYFAEKNGFDIEN